MRLSGLNIRTITNIMALKSKVASLRRGMSKTVPLLGRWPRDMVQFDRDAENE